MAVSGRIWYTGPASAIFASGRPFGYPYGVWEGVTALRSRIPIRLGAENFQPERGFMLSGSIPVRQNERASLRPAEPPCLRIEIPFY